MGHPHERECRHPGRSALLCFGRLRAALLAAASFALLSPPIASASAGRDGSRSDRAAQSRSHESNQPRGAPRTRIEFMRQQMERLRSGVRVVDRGDGSLQRGRPVTPGPETPRQ